MALGYLLVRRPYLLAHRGASGYAPENTFAAFDRAIAQRADGLETDVRASKDGRLVLMHDARVDRTTDGEGEVAELTLAELEKLDAGTPYNPRFAGERVPRLEAFLERYGDRLPLCLEVKAPGIEEQLVRLVRERGLLTGMPPAEASSREQLALPPVMFTSFDFDSCLALKKAAPEAMVGFLTATADETTVARVKKAGLEQICPRADGCTPDTVGLAKDRGLSVRAWGVRDREALRQAISAGVDGVTCDWPDWSLSPSR